MLTPSPNSPPAPNDVPSPAVTTNIDEPNGPTLPLELISKIIVELQHDRQYAVLAKMALVNSTYYDLVIPKLYETVTITDTNKYLIHHGMRAAQDSPVCLEKGVESSPQDTKTSKDRAIDFCVRMIIDTPTDGIEMSIEHMVDRLPHHSYGNVEELVFTSKALRREHSDYTIHYMNLRYFIPRQPINYSSEIEYRNLKTKRVVLHIPNEHDYDTTHRLVHALSRWCKQRSQHRGPTSFVLHNLDLEGPWYNFKYMDVDCHFNSSQMSHGGRYLSGFLKGIFQSYQKKSYPRLKLFDVDAHHLQDLADGSHDGVWLAKSSLALAEAIWDGVGDKAASIRLIMDRISFCQSEFEAEEYPTWKPTPVSIS
jgi:hypothetical protein